MARPRWALLAASILTQVALGGLNTVDGRVLYVLSSREGLGRVATSQQYLLDSPLILAIARLVHPGSLTAIGALCGAFSLLPILALAFAWVFRRLSAAQVDGLVVAACAVPAWKFLALYLGKPDGLTLLLSAVLVWSQAPGVLLVAGCLLIANHIQQGIVILCLLGLLAWPDKRRAMTLVLTTVPGLACARLLQLALGIHQHAGRVDYLMKLWSSETAFSLPLLGLAAVGCLGCAWVPVLLRVASFPRGLRVRYGVAFLVALGLGAVAVDNSRDMFLLSVPVAGACMREELRLGRLRPPAWLVLVLGGASALLPDIMSGGIRASPWTGFLEHLRMALTT